MLTQFTENVFNGVFRQSYAEHSKETPQQTLLHNKKFAFLDIWIWILECGLLVVVFLAEVFDEFEFWCASSFFRVNLAVRLSRALFHTWL